MVRKTGGLNDTVFDVDDDEERAAAAGMGTNGYSFEGTDPGALDYGLNRCSPAQPHLPLALPHASSHALSHALLHELLCAQSHVMLNALSLVLLSGLSLWSLAVRRQL